MGKNTNLHKLEQSLVRALIEVNLESAGIPFGKFTKSGLQILDANQSILGYVKPPLFNSENLYNQIEVFEVMQSFLNQVFDIFYQRKTSLTLEEFPYDDSMLPASETDKTFFSGTDAFETDGEFYKIDARNYYYTESALNVFWSINDCKNKEGSYFFENLQSFENISVSHYKGKYWYVHPRFQLVGDMTFYNVPYNIESLKELKDIIEYKKIEEKYSGSKIDDKAFLKNELSSTSSFWSPSDYYYNVYDDKLRIFAFGEKEKVLEEANEVKTIIENSIIDVLIDSIMDRLTSLFGLSDSMFFEEIRDLLYKIHLESDISFYSWNFAEELEKKAIEMLITKDKDSFKIANFSNNFVEKIQQFLAERDLQGSYCLEFDESIEANFSSNATGFYSEYFDFSNTFNGAWKLVKFDEDGEEVDSYHLSWEIAGSEDIVAKLEEAIDSIEQKERILKERLAQEALILENADKFYVTLEDSYQAGNCKVGTLNFCNKHNINLSKIAKLRADRLLKLIDQETDAINRHLALNALYVAFNKYRVNANI